MTTRTSIGWLYRGATGRKEIAYMAVALSRDPRGSLLCAMGRWTVREFYREHDWLERGYARLRPGDVECVELQH